MPGKQDGPSRIIYGPPRPPRIAQNAHFFTLGPIYEKLISLVINLSALLWGLTTLKFSFTWVWRKAPPGPPKYEKKVLFFFHILGLNLKMSYQIASLFHMYIDMGERIAGKQDRSDHWRPPQGPQNILFFYILAHKWKNGFQIVPPCCT